MGFAERLARQEPWRDFPGNISVAAWGLAEREPVLVDAGRVVHAASTIKVAVLLAALREVETGQLGLDEDIPLPGRTERARGTGVLKEMRCPRLPLDDLLTLMIVVSDNAATNAVLDLVGFDAVHQLLVNLGCTDTRVQRHLMDTAADGVLETTALDQARILDRLVAEAALPPAATGHAMHKLVRQQVRDRIPARLPWRARSWNKTGEVRGVRHDVALLGRDSPECVLAVLTDEVTDEEAACAHIAEIGRVAHAALFG